MSESGLAPEQENAALELLLKLFEQPESVDFQDPVDYEALDLPDYPRVITSPMDLGTVRQNLEAGAYESLYEFMDDLQLIWTNCKTYNKAGSKIVQRARKLERMTQRWFAQLDEGAEDEEDSEDSEESEESDEPAEITFEDQVDLAERIRRLDSSVLAEVIYTVREAHPEAIEDFGEDKVKVRIDGIAKEVFVAIWEIVENDFMEKQKREMERRLKELAEEENPDEEDDEEDYEVGSDN